MTLQCGSKIGSYVILDRIGKGGCGVVYKVRDTQDIENIFALKIVSESKSDDYKDNCAYLLNEYRVLKDMNCVGIPRVYEYSSHEEHPYLVMDYLEGPDLYSLIEKNKKISWKRSVKILKDISEVLVSLDFESIVHRDIKPENLLFSSDGRWHLIDFGLVYDPCSPCMEDHSDILGTVFYMSPEYIKDSRKRLTVKSDIYSLGVTMHYALSGSRFFSGDTRKVLKDHLNKKLPSVKSIPVWLNNLIQKMTCKSIKSRPSPSEVLSVIEKNMKGVL